MTFIADESMSILRTERKGRKGTVGFYCVLGMMLGTWSSRIFFYSTLYLLCLITMSDTQYVIQYICVLFKSGKEGEMERSMLDNNLFI